MLEEDYLSMNKHLVNGQKQNTTHTTPIHHSPLTINQIGSQIIRFILIPALTKEVNEGKNFAQLRQVFYSLILATWYKKKIKDSILNQVYSNRNKIGGVKVSAGDKDKIYQEYLRAFKKGVYNYIKEEPDQITGQTVPRKYFSGGVGAYQITNAMISVGMDKANLAMSELRNSNIFDVDGNVTPAMIGQPPLAMFRRADAAMNAETQGGYHFWKLRSILESFDDQNHRHLMADPLETDIFRKFFKGHKVLNVAPSNDHFNPDDPALLDRHNIMTALRAEDIDAYALSPGKPHQEWKQCFFNNKVQGMKDVADNTFDDVVCINFFGSRYLYEPKGSYPQIAEELKRVLKEGGIFYSDLTDRKDSELEHELLKKGFEIVESSLKESNFLC